MEKESTLVQERNRAERNSIDGIRSFFFVSAYLLDLFLIGWCILGFDCLRIISVFKNNFTCRKKNAIYKEVLNVTSC